MHDKVWIKEVRIRDKGSRRSKNEDDRTAEVRRILEVYIREVSLREVTDRKTEVREERTKGSKNEESVKLKNSKNYYRVFVVGWSLLVAT